MHVQCACSYRTHRFISGSNAPPMYRTFYGILYFFGCRTALSHNELVVCGDRRQHSRLMNDDSSSLMNTEWDRSDKQNERHLIIIFCSLNRWFRVDCCSFNPTYLYTSFSNKEEQLGMPSFSFHIQHEMLMSIMIALNTMNIMYIPCMYARSHHIKENSLIYN